MDLCDNDLQLKQRVLNRLQLEPNIDPAALGVCVENGVVTLQGTVENDSDRVATERVVRELKGVRGVRDDDLQVNTLKRSRPADQDIEASAREAIQWLTNIEAEDLNVTSKNGWLTLHGTVGSRHQGRTLKSVLRDLPGVCGVTSELKIKRAEVSL